MARYYCTALTREVFADKVRSVLSILGYDASIYVHQP